jgi:hypothetical protein
MKDEIKIGDIFEDNFDHEEVEIVFKTKDNVIYRVLDGNYERFSKIDAFLKLFSIKKPEPELKKLVAWVNNDGHFCCMTFDDKYKADSNWTKKEIIIKDGVVYVDMSEV